MSVLLVDDQKIDVVTSQDLFPVMQKILMDEEESQRLLEHLWVVGLNAKDRVCCIELMSQGNGKMAELDPMQLFKIAIYKGATKLVLVHNSPSQELTPSQLDKDFTDNLIQMGNIIELEVSDHLIINPESYLSFEDSGIMEELKLSQKFLLPFQEGERIRKQARKFGRMKVSKKARNTEGKKSHKKRR